MLLKHASELKKQISTKDESCQQTKKVKEIENKRFKETW